MTVYFGCERQRSNTVFEDSSLKERGRHFLRINAEAGWEKIGKDLNTSCDPPDLPTR